MLDPRIYRTGLVVVALAVVVLAFSLQNQQPGLSSSLAPDAFNGQDAYATMNTIAAADPLRTPGSAGDFALAAQVASSFRTAFGSSGVSTDIFTGHTADGTRTLENVIAVRPGMESGSVVIVAPRDARASPAVASLSATATLIELARDLSGETLHRTVVLASTSGSQGGAGALRLASTLSGPIDAMIVLGDLASAPQHQPVVVPWSDAPAVAPPTLRNTLALALGAQASLPAGGTDLAGQFAHLAFPLTVSAQGPFGAHGIPAVLLSRSGERGPAPDAPLGAVGLMNSLGRAVLQSISALDRGPTVPAPSSYLLLAGKIVPGWAVSLLVAALVVPVLLTTVDGLARARRREQAIWRWVMLFLAAALPFVLAALVVLAGKVAGLIAVAPPEPIPAGSVPLKGSGIAVLGAAALAALAALALLRLLVAKLGIRVREPGGDGGAPALLLVMVLVTFSVWLANPFAALLLVPALHLWLLAINSNLRLAFPLRLMLVLAGLLPPALITAYYAVTLGFSPLDTVWTAALLIAGGGVHLVAVLEWSIVLGCAVNAVARAAHSAHQPRPEPAPITVRGPITYAGPGSLGGTESALRR